MFAPLLVPNRYKGAWGGRGSGKSHFFAEQLVFQCLETKGTRAVGIREVQKDLKHSSKALIEDKIRTFQLWDSGFKSFESEIRTPGDGLIIFQGMQSHNADSIKSLEGFDIAWVEEAQTLSKNSLTMLRPTIRKPGSSIWASWNPRKKSDAIDEFMRRGSLPDGVVVKANWRDNPFWTDELEKERLLDLARYPDRYPHIWEGEYARALDGAYYARELALARSNGQIKKDLIPDPLLPLRAVCDIGGAGAKADAFVIWIVQHVGERILFLDYYESIGQTLGYHVDWMRRRGHDRAKFILPHDGINANNITGKTYEAHIREAGFATEVIPNQGAGAAMMRIEAGRRMFPRAEFHEVNCEAGLDALGYYHEKKDEERDVGMGPDHDWSSHGSDAFGLACVTYSEPGALAGFLKKDLPYPASGIY